jgi:hypothetical protein
VDVFLESLGPPPPGFIITLPRVSALEHVQAMADLCERLEQAHGLDEGSLCFEIQVETTRSIFDRAGIARIPHLVAAGEGRCVGLHYNTYAFSQSVGIAAELADLDHPTAHLAKAMLLIATAESGIRLSDSISTALPVGDTATVQAAWALHAVLARQGMEGGIYHGWDAHPAQLPTRFGAAFTFFRRALPTAVDRLGRRLSRGVDEPTEIRALARFLLRGLDCGAFDDSDVEFDRATLLDTVSARSERSVPSEPRRSELSATTLEWPPTLGHPPLG